MRIYSDENIKGFITSPLSSFDTKEKCVLIGDAPIRGTLLAFGIPPQYFEGVESGMINGILIAEGLTREQTHLLKERNILRRSFTQMIEDGPAEFIYSIMESARAYPTLSIYIDQTLEDIRPIELAFFLQKLKLLKHVNILAISKGPTTEKLLREWI